VTHEQGNGQKEGQQEEAGQDIVGEASGETRKAGKQAISERDGCERIDMTGAREVYKLLEELDGHIDGQKASGRPGPLRKASRRPTLIEET